MIEYVTKRESRNMALQVCKIGSSRYVRLVRASDGKIANRWDSAPFCGKLTDLYMAFDAAMTQDIPDGDDFTPDQIAFVLGLSDMLKREGPTRYVLNA